MRLVRLSILLVLFAAAASHAQAQMVVNRETGEQVDYPYFTGIHQRVHHLHSRRYGARLPRFVVVRATFPTPQPFGWMNCCE